MISTSNEMTAIRLVAKSQSGAMRTFDLSPEQSVFVGQSDNCGLQLSGDGIGGIHCRFGFEDGNLIVQDWMSSEGTNVNGQPIDSSHPLQIGDCVQIGSQQITIRDAKSTSTRSERDTEDASSEETLSADPEEPAVVMESVEAEPESIPAFEGGLLGPESMDFDADFSQWEEDETFDRETVELLRAEIEELQTALAQRDSEQIATGELESTSSHHHSDDSTVIDQRIQELIEEANRSDERAAVLEEMLHAAEDSSRNEVEERNQLEAWVGDIETRIGQREQEHAAEVDALRQRLEESQHEQDQLRRKLSQAAYSGNAPQQYEETLEKLQQANRQLQDKLTESEKQQIHLQQQLDDASNQHDRAMREERANIAKEQARISRLRFELSQKLSDVEELPKEENVQDKEASHRLRALREHLREIHEQEKKEEAEATIATRIAKLWKRVEY